jgi:hypothetical protein
MQSVNNSFKVICFAGLSIYCRMKNYDYPVNICSRLHEALHVKIQVFWVETLNGWIVPKSFKGAMVPSSSGSSSPRRVALWQMLYYIDTVDVGSRWPERVVIQ